MRKWWLGGLVVVGLIVFWLSRLSVKGKIIKNPVNRSVIPTPMEYARHEGRDISFNYENKYQLRERNEGNWELVGNSGVMSQIVIMASPINSKDIEDVSGVKMRRVKNQIYREEKIYWGETEGVVFWREDTFERVAFFIKNGLAVSVAMTSNSRNDDEKLIKEFEKLVGSIELK